MMFSTLQLKLLCLCLLLAPIGGVWAALRERARGDSGLMVLAFVFGTIAGPVFAVLAVVLFNIELIAFHFILG